MIQLVITKTAKSFDPRASWYECYKMTKVFRDMEEAKQYLKGAYGKCTKRCMFVDTKEGESKKIGWVFGYRDTDYSQTPISRMIANDWVHFYEVKDYQFA